MNFSSSRALILHPLVTSSRDDILAETRFAIECQQSFSSSSSHELSSLSLVDFTCDETIYIVLSFLDGPSLCSARSVCRSWHQLSNDDQLWLHLCHQEFRVSPTQLAKQPESYQKLYQFACRSLKTLLRDYVHEQCLSNLQNSLQIPRAAALTLIALRSSV